jgi:YegS/Rv2252/BmrU family lipid kinase
MAIRRRALILVNPAAGRSRSRQAWLMRVVRELESLGCVAVMRMAGDDIGGLERLARDAEASFDVIVAAGGDGTINAVVNGLAANPRPLAILPMGTANVLAREIGLPRSPAALARLIASGPVQRIWPGRCGDRLFLMMASTGFDAEVVQRIDPRLKRLLGRVAFVSAVFGRLLNFQPCMLTAEIDGQRYSASTVIVTKGRFYAGPFLIAPDASLAEPAVHLVLFRRDGRIAACRYLGALVTGFLPRRADVTILRGRSVRITAAAPVPVQADGEIVAVLPVEIGVAAHPIELICP